MTNAASPAPPSRTMVDCGTKSQRCMRCSNSAHSAGERPAKSGMSVSEEIMLRDIIIGSFRLGRPKSFGRPARRGPIGPALSQQSARGEPAIMACSTNGPAHRRHHAPAADARAARRERQPLHPQQAAHFLRGCSRPTRRQRRCCATRRFRRTSVRQIGFVASAPARLWRRQRHSSSC